MSASLDFFWNRNRTLVSDAEESARKEREEERQLMADILCQDGFYSRNDIENKENNECDHSEYEYELIDILSYRSFI
jgi:hypothetical protein